MNKPITKITQYYPARSLGKQTLELSMGKIIVSYKNLFATYNASFDLKDFNPNYDTGRWSFDNWSNFFFFFLVISIFIRWIPLIKDYSILALALSLIFLLLNFKKYEWVYFWDKNRINNIPIRYSGSILTRKEKKNFVQNMVEEINKTQN